jgi:type IV pilus assembly protein PilE
MKHANKRAGGFTLIEVVVVMIIIAVVSAIAIPSYTGYVNRSKRAAAKAVLTDTANQLERNYTSFGCYNKSDGPTCQTQAAGNDFVLTSTVAPIDGRASYAIAVAFPVPPAPGIVGQSFALTATPCGTAGTCPAGSEAFVEPDCGTLQLTQAGARTSTGTLATATCWQK